ncbi:hypothetical protein CUREO_1252 [Campylobacter ureolyticus RIGS 9880]|uniref:Uncharacterized protein n=1 Tax=Campylobacter ureolyticus RIGS 9880 TaxID=1032069 RepID=A0AAU8U4J9_9BACT|nr:hypothetical protein CUREO_1252 [Campylobacter ureolyticus RIGS 9880]
MTLKQEQQLEQLLKQWREERRLSIENQRDGLIGNLCEEMAEYYRATNDDEKIDALCDMGVFAYNSLDTGVEDLWGKLNDSLLNTRFFPLSTLDEVSQVDYTIKRQAILDANTDIYRLIKACEKETSIMGYDFYKCMLETIKEISSRTGHYDENIHKFVKDKSREAVKKWYKADYDKCKIKG